MAGLPIASELNGQDLTALLRDPPEQRFVFGENYRSNRLITTGGAYVTDGHCKYIWNSWPGRELLFDLNQAPQELHDLSGDGKYRDTLLQMRQIVIDEYRTRPVDEMPDENGQLKAGRVLPAYRPERNGAPPSSQSGHSGTRALSNSPPTVGPGRDMVLLPIPRHF